MSTAVTIIVVIAVLAVAGFAALLTFARRSDVRGAGALSRETIQRDKKSSASEVVVPEPPTGREIERLASAQRSGALEPAKEFLPAPFIPPDIEAVGVSRRQFFNRANTILMSAGLGAFGVSIVAFLWPDAKGGFGSKVNAGKLDDLLVQITANDNFLYLPEARTWLTAYPTDALPKAKVAYAAQPSVLGGMEAGVVALYQKCPHLGCRVPECKTSQWFECPCHGSQYNRVGEKKGGPAPRGMDRFGVDTSGGNVVIDTGAVFNGPPIGTNTTGQEAEGPHCITGGGGH
jgi:cytochrome b6-f complex iron-sulfur subunit